MNTQATLASTSCASGTSAELFALTDEQILDIAPETASSASASPGVILSEAKNLSSAPPSTKPQESQKDSSPAAQAMAQRPSVVGLPQNDNAPKTDHGTRATGHDSEAPPPWLAAQMKDPWSGEEATEFWNGVQQAKSEAAAYRAAIATPEDARTLKELYPGGIAEARTAADRARMLDQIDNAYFGGEGNSPEQRSASRAQLAQQLLREDPAAFREMLAAGLQALQEATEPQSHRAKSLAPALASENDATSPSSVAAQHAAPVPANAHHDVARHSPLATGHSDLHGSRATDHDPRLAAYAVFERAANDDLERSVGTAIDRALTQALPVAQPLMAEQRKGLATNDSAQARSSALRERLSTGIRAEIEKALQNDRQLGEQVAQILASRRFDTDTRAQVVRLINDRAQQLVPAAAKRILNDWTQTTLAAHRSRTQRDDAVADVAPASGNRQSSDWPDRSKDRPLQPAAASRDGAANSPRRVDYRKLSDEQILNL